MMSLVQTPAKDESADIRGLHECGAALPLGFLNRHSTCGVESVIKCVSPPILFRPMLRRCFLSVAVLLSTGTSVVMGQVPSITTLAHFSGANPGTPEGSSPQGALIFGADGQLYGTAEQGGAGSGSGNGVAFKMTTGGTVTTLAEFGGTTTGSSPNGTLTLADDGYYYGTTAAGGSDGDGTVFQLTPTGTLTTLYTFKELTKKDTGTVPKTHLTRGKDGYLYGTTSQGGNNGYGTIFKILPGSPNTPIRVVDFSGQGGNARGSLPSALLLATDGNFYGTTEGGGIYSNGTVFRLTPVGAFTTIADFGSLTGTYTGPISPRSELIQVASGVMYGTSAGGGTSAAGTVYSVTTAGVNKVVINFTGDTGSYVGSTPEAPLYLATDGYFYGTTRLGGTSQRGTVFRFIPGGVFKSLIQFTGGATVYGAYPRAPLVQDNEGHLFGTTSGGGQNSLGTIFSLTDALPPKPVVITGNVVNPSGGTRLTFSGIINPRGTATRYYFEYGTTTDYGSRIPATDASAGAGTTDFAVPASFTAVGLTPATPYHFRLRASNGGGTTLGADQQVITNPTPNIVSYPADQLVGTNSPATFQIVGADPESLRYAWSAKTGAATAFTGISGATASIFQINKAALANAGLYSVTVTSSGDSLTTTPARLGVVNSAVTTVVVKEGRQITLTLSKAGPDLTYQWKNSAGSIVDDGRIKNSTTANLEINNAQGSDQDTYYCEVSLGALKVNSGPFNLSVILKPVIDSSSLPSWTTNGLASGVITAKNGPLSFAASPLPGGVSFTTVTTIDPTTKIKTVTGVFSGRPTGSGAFHPNITASNEAGTGPQYTPTINVVPAQPGELGAYAGLVNRDLTSNNNMGGFFSLNLSYAGIATGKITHKGVTYSFTGVLSPAPGATRTISFTPDAKSKASFPPLTATLTGATGDVSGTLNGLAFTAKHSPWGASNPMPMAKTGTLTVAFKANSAQADNPAIPQGSGYGVLTIDSNGVATLTNAMLSDGTAFTASSVVASDDTVVFHVPLYAAGTGSAQGTLVIGTDKSVTSTDFDWLKTPQTIATRSYKAGFALHPLDVVGGAYNTATSGANVIGLTGSTANAQLKLSDGGLVATVTQLVNFPATNAITVPTNLNKITVAFPASKFATGIFTGTFSVPDVVAANTRTVTFSGIFVQGTHQGLGYFNLAQLPSPATSALLSGNVILAAP